MNFSTRKYNESNYKNLMISVTNKIDFSAKTVFLYIIIWNQAILKKNSHLTILHLTKSITLKMLVLVLCQI